jgi:hypothetical protein
VIPKEKQSAAKKEGKYCSKTNSVARRILYYKNSVRIFSKLPRLFLVEKIRSKTSQKLYVE